MRSGALPRRCCCGPERTGLLYEVFQRECEAAIAAREAAAKALREQHLAYRRRLLEWYRQRFRQERVSGLSGHAASAVFPVSY
jgi:hypothetical protein